MSSHLHPRRHHARAFSLLELLAVIAIVALLTAVVGLTVPAAIASQQLAGAARQLASDLEHARLIAQRDSKPVEVRFYRHAVAGEPGSLTAIRSYQIGEIQGWDKDGLPQLRFLAEIQPFNSGIILMPDPAFTSLLQQERRTPGAQDPNLGIPYDFFAYQIRPDGATNLPRNAPAVLTLVHEPQNGSLSKLPPDYRSITLDPVNGKIRAY